MVKIPPEDQLKIKVEEHLKKRHWRRVCLLVLLLLPQGKLASRYFIYDKIEEWGLWENPDNQEIDDRINDKTSTLLIISKSLYCLFVDGFLRREDLSRLSRESFNKICKERVLGKTEKVIAIRGVQSVFFLSPKGRQRAREIMLPPKNKFFKFFRIKREAACLQK